MNVDSPDSMESDATAPTPLPELELESAFPHRARVVIVGGGIMGCSVAYHLSLLGWTDVVVLEQGELAGGTTWHAAGMVGQLRASNSMTKINKYSVQLYQTLEAETGINTGWKEVGSLIVGQTKARMTQLRRTAAMAQQFGVEAHLIDPSEAAEKWPLLRTDDILGGVWLPHDGKVKPEGTARALAQGARTRGVQILENTRVSRLNVHHGAITGVDTEQGTIEAEYVVLCGGMWSRAIAQHAGVSIPLYPVEHHYVVSAPIEGAFDELPCGRDPDAQIYFRGEDNAIMLGAFQNRSKPWNANPIPHPFSFSLLEDDWEKFSEPLAAGKHRIPALADAEFPKFVNGPESFTPDNNFILGETPEVDRLFVGAGFNSVGIASAGGAGKYLAEWIVSGEATMDLWSVDVRRFMPFHNNREYLRHRVGEVLGLHYQMAWPNREPETARNLRMSPLHDRLKDAGACFGVKMGLERPNWFAPENLSPTMTYTFEKPDWLPYSALEHQAAREAVALFDQTSFSKYRLEGPGALEALQRLCGGNVDVSVGRAVYTGMFNDRGRFESDVTVVRLAPEAFYIISASSQTRRDYHWIRRNMRDGTRAVLTDVTTSYGVIGVMGPRSRALLQQVSDADFSPENFPFATAQETSIGLATGLALRMSYVGELGWELHVPMDQMGAAYDALWNAGQDFGVRNAGHYAINSLRLEKGYRAWGADISPDDTPFEAGLGFAVSWEKSIPFIGHDTLMAQWEDLPKKMLVSLVLDDSEVMIWGNEPILRDGENVGYTTSAAFGHTLGAGVALGYIHYDGGVTPEFLERGHYGLLVDGTLVSAQLHLESPYDPKRTKLHLK